MVGKSSKRLVRTSISPKIEIEIEMSFVQGYQISCSEQSIGQFLLVNQTRLGQTKHKSCGPNSRICVLVINQNSDARDGGAHCPAG